MRESMPNCARFWTMPTSRTKPSAVRITSSTFRTIQRFRLASRSLCMKERKKRSRKLSEPTKSDNGQIVFCHMGRIWWQIWADDETPLSDILVASLRENQIHARFEKAEGKNAIFVLPEDEKRAREIVREIVEGAPPA